MIYDTVKKYADEKGLAISVVEEKAGLGRGTIGKWRSTNTVMVENLLKVAKVLDVTASDLLRDADAVPKQT